MKKYEITEETMEIDEGRVLHRIRALRDIDIPDDDPVMKGELGGWIEKESNLSQEDSAWIFDGAYVYDDARVEDDAVVYPNTHVFGKALICDNAYIGHYRVRYPNPNGFVKIYGNAIIKENAYIYGNARIVGHAEISGNAHIGCYSKVGGNAKICGNVNMRGNPIICENALIEKINHYLTIEPIGKFGQTLTIFRCDDGSVKIRFGCFVGTVEEFLKNDEHNDLNLDALVIFAKERICEE